MFFARNLTGRSIIPTENIGLRIKCCGSETIFVGSESHFPREFWIRILLDLQKVADPTLNIHSFTMLMS
jgi:hypothetical protein